MLALLIAIFCLINCHLSSADKKAELADLLNEMNPFIMAKRLTDNKNDFEQFCGKLDKKYNNGVKLLEEVYLQSPMAKEVLKNFFNYQPWQEHCKDDLTKSRYLKAAQEFNAKSLNEFQRYNNWYHRSLAKVIKRKENTQLTFDCFNIRIYRDAIKLVSDDVKSVLGNMMVSMNPTGKKLFGDDLDKKCKDVTLPEPEGNLEMGHFALDLVDAMLNVQVK